MVYLEIALAAMIAATLDTVIGFGGGLLLLPVLVMVIGSKDAVLLSALIPLGWNIPRLLLLRDSVNWKIAGLFAIGIVPGAGLGAMLLDVISPVTLQLVIGIVITLFGLYYITRLYLDLPQPRGFKSWVFPVAGLLSGIVSGVLGAGNGPLQTGALAGASLPVREIAATNGAVGAITAVSRAVGYMIQGLYFEGIWVPATIGIVAATAGTFIGVRLSRRSKDSTLELLVGIALVLAGVKMVMG